MTDFQNRRAYRRIPRRFAVRYGLDSPSTLGFTINVSFGGVAITSPSVFSRGSMLVMRLQADDREIPLKGEVRWVNTTENAVSRRVAYEMGVMLTEQDPYWPAFLQKVIEEFVERRRDPRLPKSFKVSVTNAGEVRQEMTRDVSRGGLFVITDNPSPLMTIIEVRLYLLDAMDVITAEAQVVHVVDAQKSREFGIPQGMGVQFTRFFDDDREKLSEYLKKLAPGGTE